jgi:hypothetical protein
LERPPEKVVLEQGISTVTDAIMLRKVKRTFSCFVPYTAHIAVQRKVPEWFWDLVMSKEFFMSVLSKPVEANSYFGSFIVESLNGTLIVLSALLAIATVAVVA